MGANVAAAGAVGAPMSANDALRGAVAAFFGAVGAPSGAVDVSVRVWFANALRLRAWRRFCCRWWTVRCCK